MRSGDSTVVLAPASGRLVLDAFDAVRHEATKWRLKTGRAGRLVVFNPKLVERIEHFLADRETV